MAKIQTSPKKNKLVSEQITIGEVAKISYTPETGKPEKCSLHFKVAGSSEPLVKDYAANMDEKSFLRNDVETIVGQPFADDESASDYDLDALIGKKIPVVVVHKGSAGGKPVAAIGPVFSLKKIKDAAAALL
jgi:hypothetical protein